jgi:murein DD-endopeptidase MepM/ murein hydrolase activator NlpD
MTDLPSPSGRPGNAFSAAFGLFRPVLLAAGAIGVALGALLLSQLAAPSDEASAPPPATAPAPVAVALPGPEEAPPVTAADFKGFQVRLPAEPAAEPEPARTEPYEVTLRLERGDTVDKLLADLDVPPADRRQIDEKLKGLLKKRRLAAGETLNLVLQNMPEQPDAPRVLSLGVRPQPEREYSVTRQDDGSYRGEEKIYKVSPRIVRVAAARDGSLQQSGIRSGAPSAAMLEFIRALSYDVDFQRELKEGHKFTVLLEQLVTSDGRVTHPGRLLAGQLQLAKRTVTIIRFRPKGGADQFYSPQGESVVRSFLRTPMDASRITSRFGMREHPILGFSALHAGVDFAAPSGTPVLAAGAGRVRMAGSNGGYGVYVKLDHTAEVGTAYAHLSRLGPGIKPGVAVRQGQVIGFVGSTGMSTGPHLHYEFIRAGRAVNPTAQKFAMRAALGGKDLATFQTLNRQYAAHLKSAPTVADLTKPKPRDASLVARGD